MLVYKTFSIKTRNVSFVLVLELKVAKEDIGKVIGKKGRNVQAIRTILNAASGKVKKHAVIEIID